MKILVTGAAGFIGYHMVSWLVDRGDEVVGLDSINAYYDVNLKIARLDSLGVEKNNILFNKILKSTSRPNFRFVKINIENHHHIDNLFANEKFDAVCHLAAQPGVRYSLENPRAYMTSNMVGFLNILEASRHNKVKHLVYASSSSVYGLNKKMPLSVSDNVDHPISLYAATKKSNELMAHTYSHLYGLPTTGLRFFTVYGPWGRPDMALFLFVDAILKNKPIKVYNNGNMMRDFTYVSDIVNGVLKVLDRPPELKLTDEVWDDKDLFSNAPYRIYNIGNGKPVRLTEFIRLIEDKLGIEAKKEMMPAQPGDMSKTFADTSILRQELDYEPVVQLKDGVSRFVEWYKKYYEIDE